MRELGLDAFTICINNRKLLNGYFEHVGIENTVDVLRIIDKLDKIGEDLVQKELESTGIDKQAIESIIKFIKISGKNNEILRKLKDLNVKDELFLEGLTEMEQVVYYMGYFGIPEGFYNINLKITRGLDYYTGTVYETMLDDYPTIGSVCSGGRYDDLAQNYTKEKLAGVGISIGLTRLFYQLREANLLKMDSSPTTSEILIIPMSEGSLDYSIELVNELRKNKIRSELYVETGKLVKKMTYANKIGVPYTIIIGDEEVETKLLSLRNMKTGLQDRVGVEKIISLLQY